MGRLQAASGRAESVSLEQTFNKELLLGSGRPSTPSFSVAANSLCCFPPSLSIKRPHVPQSLPPHLFLALEAVSLPSLSFWVVLWFVSESSHTVGDCLPSSGFVKKVQGTSFQPVHEAEKEGQEAGLPATQCGERFVKCSELLDWDGKLNRLNDSRRLEQTG